MSVDFIFGERKYIRFDIKSTIQQAIVVTSATWKLFKGEEVVASGTCDIAESNTLEILLQPEETGKFTLEVEYEIPPEIRKVRCNVDVY